MTMLLLIGYPSVRSPPRRAPRPLPRWLCRISRQSAEVHGARLPDPPAGLDRGKKRAEELSRQAGFQSSAEGTRSARLKRELAFSHAISIVSSAICSSS